MNSEQAAFLAAQGRHNCYIILGKQQHYVEHWKTST